MNATDYLAEHGISDQSIDKFGITYTEDQITIPIKNEDGVVLFNKHRILNGKMKYKNEEGSHATLFNISALKSSDYVFITEGEMDCIRLDQEGIVAVSNTSGASTFNKDWVPLFDKKKVYIVYDNDDAGREGAAKLKKLIPNAYIIELPDGFKDVCEYFAIHSKSQFGKLVKEQTSISYNTLCETIDKWLLLPDKNVIKVLLASLVAHHFTTDPLWMFFVAPSSGSKTELISMISKLPFVYFLSDMTPQTLASGMKTKEENDPSLLLKLKDNVVVMKDFTTVLSMRHDDRAMIMSQLREVYDGKYSKAFGTGKKVEWEGRLTLIAGVTTIIDTYSAVFQVMGERFIMYRIPQSEDEHIATKALGNYGVETQMRQELHDAMNKYFSSLKIPHVRDIVLPEDILQALASLASFVVRARSNTIRDNYKKEITYIPEPESPARFAKQIGTLIKALAVVNGREVVTWDDYYLTLRVALDAVPTNKIKHIIALCDRNRYVTTAQIIQESDYSRSGAENILEDLVAFGLAEIDRGSGSGSTHFWRLSDKAYGYFKKMLPEEKPELYVYFKETDHYYKLIQEMLIGRKADDDIDDLTREGFPDASELL